jgi:putative membrane protein
MVWGMIMMVLFWGGLIALVVWGVQSVTRGNEPPQPPLDVAKGRLARGEITVEEFERVARVLERKLETGKERSVQV